MKTRVESIRRIAGRAALGLGLSLTLAVSTAASSTLFFDDFESGTGQWSLTGTWGTSGARSVSPSLSLTDSPGAFYSNNTDSAAAIAQSLDLGALSRPVLVFHHGHALEQGFDFGRVEISLDGGASWETVPLASYTGVRRGMTREQIELDGFAAESDVRIRFRIVTDASVVMEGWYLDDVRVADAPESATLAEADAGDIGQTAVTLRWSAPSDPGFAAFRILRAPAGTGFDWRNARVVGEVDNPETDEFTDISVAPKSSYRYAVMTLRSNDTHALSNVIDVTTPAGMDYPFLDNGEAGPNFWVATAPWALTTEDFRSPGHSWADSPGENYQNNISSQPLTLAAPFSLAGAVDPVLTFWNRRDIAAGDLAAAEISTNLGGSWTTLASFGPGQTSGWRQERIPLSAYVGEAAVLIRFRLSTDANHNAEGWFIDDISVAEAPPVVAAPAIDQVASHGMRLTWNAPSAPLFSHYAIHRAVGSEADIHSPLVATITDPTQTQFVDAGLSLDTLYAYRVYVVTPYGTYSSASPTSATMRTLNNPLPFEDGFEGSLVSWNSGSDSGTSLWGISDDHSAEGAFSLASNPGTMYPPNTNTWIETAVDLRDTEWPVLSFWDRYGLNSGDWIRLEISATGGPSANVYGAYETSRAHWHEQRVDLSPWKGLGNVRLRFRLVSDNSATPGEGWFIDDVRVAENPNRNTPLSLPFTEDFESAGAGWLLAGWMIEPDGGAVDGDHVLRTGATGRRMLANTQHWAVLDRPVQLAQGSKVQATFWTRGRLDTNSYLRLNYSLNGGVGWSEFGSVNRNPGFNTTTWTRGQAGMESLVASAPQTVRLRFAVSCDWRSPVADISLDKLTVSELHEPVNLLTAEPALRSVDLTWSPSTIGAAFQRYEVWRSTSANVSPSNGQKVFESGDPNVTTHTDTGLNIGGTYFYRVFVVDGRDVYSLSNELSATTVPVAIPFADAMDSMDNWVTGSNNANPSTWAVNTNDPFEGTGSLATVAVGQYAPNTDSYIETAVDLRNTEWPVLSFWDRYGLNSGDWIRLEISAIGGPSANVYGAYETSRAHWHEQRVDLSPWKGLGNVRLRFRLVSDNAATPGEGWFIDDVRVAENPNRNTPLSLPFTEDFESAGAGWLLAGWMIEPDEGAVDGGHVLRTGATGRRMLADTQHWAVLDRPVQLEQGSKVQATFWTRGRLDTNSYLRLNYSLNGGIGWSEFGSVNRNPGFNTTTWTRGQAGMESLATSAPQTVRLRFAVSCDWRSPVAEISLDKLTVSELHEPVNLLTAEPALRSVELTWSSSAIGAAFQRYEVWRSTSANVSPSNGQKVFESGDPAVTTHTDTGLNIGGTYFYRVFVVDERDVYSLSNELSATTVPVAIPFADAMDSMDNWVTGSNNANPSTWAVNTNDPFEGTGSLATVAVGQYAPNTDSYIETAVDLRDTEWPVLSFWDRYGLNSGDWIRLEISATGGPSANVYGAYETSRAHWHEQRVDLSPWKGLGNVRLRFRLVSDNSATPGEGWFIDDVRVAENPNRNTPLSLPFTEDFESAGAGWLLAGWMIEPDDGAVDGDHVLRTGATGRRMLADTQHWAVLDRPVQLAQGSKVQATFWTRGRLDTHSYLRLHYSLNGGIGWSEFGSVNRNPGFNTTTWTRGQAGMEALATSAPQTVRLRFAVSCDWRSPVADISLDKLTVSELHEPVAMLPIDEIGVDTLRLNWEPSELPTFSAYSIFRSTAANVSDQSTLVAVIADPTVASFTDTGLDARVQYYYRVVLVDDRDTHSPSDVVSAITKGIPLPYVETFDSPSPGWTFTGQWGVQAGVGRNGGAALTDSPGDYLPGTDTSARFAVNLNGTAWPVLRYWDRHEFAGSSWGRVEVSTDNNSWTIVGGVTETRTTWQKQEIDLSPWKNQPRVFVRFRSNTDGNLADGWTIDDLAIDDREAGKIVSFFDSFENGTSQWLASAWTPVNDAPYAGSFSLQDTPDRRNPPDTPNQLVLAHELDLTEAVDPSLTYFIRGTLPTNSYFRVQISTNGGLAWSEIPALNRNPGFNSTSWIREQVSLVPWIGQVIRLRFVSSSDWRQPQSDIFLDNIGIGEPTPGAPVPLSPFENETVTIVRPTLIVQNAIDYQSDALAYQFEVYADAALSLLVAQVPSVASGAATTSWQVDVDLPDNAPYWWRARALKGETTGPWSEPVAFNLNEFNNPPLPVQVAGPANDSLMLDGNGLLLWFQTSDPDPGDTVLDYHIQISADPEFSAIAVDAPGIVVAPEVAGPGQLAAYFLGDLPGGADLPSGRWFWRIRARDQRFAWGVWSEGFAYFRLPTFYQRYLRQIYPDPDWFLLDVSDPHADPDGNGVGVLMEFAIGIAPGEEPGDRLPRPIEVIVDGKRHQGFEWTSRRLHELNYRLESSTNLRTWTVVPGPAVETLHEVDALTDRVRLVDPLPVGAWPTRFIRLTISD